MAKNKKESFYTVKVLVLSGDNSPEREVSLRSGRAVKEALSSLGHQIFEYDPAEGYPGLNKFQGKVDCVLPILHGKGGEDGKIQLQLEQLGLKYLGANSMVSALCFDKLKFKEEIKQLDVLTPAYEVVDANSYKSSSLAQKPHVLKPIDGGSSLDTFIARNGQRVNESIFSRHPQMLLEELIEGRELTVPILDSSALPVIEIVPPEGKEFDYENKYNGASQELCPPKNILNEKQTEAQSIAELIHRSLGVRHLSRTDIIINDDGQLWVLELNTIPGLTAQSLYPKSAAVAGISMTRLVEKFLYMATYV